jgi:hypothetical protein
MQHDKVQYGLSCKASAYFNGLFLRTLINRHFRYGGQSETISVRVYVFRFAPQTRTLLDAAGTSHLCHWRHFAPQKNGEPFRHRIAVKSVTDLQFEA